MSSFRGGPVFPSLFIGAAGGMALSHVGGLPLVPGVAMGIGAMCVAMLKLPLTSVLLGALLVAKDAAAVMPLVIVAVTIAYVASAWLTPSAKGVETAAAPAVATPVAPAQG
jgi:H+/Cl- antiporter ClcA